MAKFDPIRDTHKSLAVRRPDVAAQWHPTKNDGLSPADVGAGSQQKVWWLAQCGHEWDAAINNHAKRGPGCPICSGQRVLAGFNDLLSQRPDIAADWHPVKNGSVTSDQVGAGSNTKVWWRGPCDHEWDAPVSSRTRIGAGCPICSGKRVLTGFNDLASQFPEVAAEWHPTKNGDLAPESVFSGSTKTAWWSGRCGHEWDQSIRKRTKRQYGCPVCSNRRVAVGSNDLATGSPEIAAEWHPTKNNTPTPESVFTNSESSAWWLGGCGHEWEARIVDRTALKRACPICSGRKIHAGVNDLRALFPEVAAEWHPTRNGHTTPDTTHPGSEKKVWWLGRCGHEWDALVASRTRSGSGCPVCSGRRLLSGFNDLATRFPDVAAEWHPTKNLDLRPHQIAAGTATRVWWLGACGHEWDATVNDRTSRGGTGCAICAGRRVLVGFNDLASQFPEVAAEWHPTRNKDVTAAEIGAGSDKKVWWLGHCGHEWDALVSNRTRVGQACPICAGSRVLAGFNDLASQFPQVAAEWHPTKNGDLTADKISKGSNRDAWWLGPCGHEWSAAVVSRTTVGTNCPTCAGKRVLAGLNDLASQFPEIAAEWHPTKNRDLTPDGILAGSAKPAWWFGACGHEWRAAIVNRTRQNTGCPVCAGLRTIAGFNDLASQFPDVAAEWHPTKNGDTAPDAISAGTSRKVWWLGHCGHEWDARVANRTRHASGCPICAGLRVLEGFNDLKSRFPEVASEWHPTKNGDARPEHITAINDRRVWWLGISCGHEWDAPIKDRTRGSQGCPICAGRRVKAGFNDLASLFPAIAAQWHPSKNGALTPSGVTSKTDKRVWWLGPCGHEFEMPVLWRTNQKMGCHCEVKVWNARRLEGFVADLGEHADSMTPAMLYAICQQAGVLASTKASDITDLLADPQRLIGLADLDSDSPLPDQDMPDSDVVEGLNPAGDIPTPDEAASATSDDTNTDDEPTCDSHDAGLPSLTVDKVLAMGEKFLASSDVDTAEYLTIAAAEQIWKIAYRLDERHLSDAQRHELQTELDKTIEPRSNQYSERIRLRFRSGYEQAIALVPAGNWSFRVGDATEVTQPNLMQKHVAAQLLSRKRVGNWSGTGAGKTVSAILAAGLLHAGHDGGIVLVICPNNVVAGWASSIKNCYPDARVASRTLSPTWVRGAGPRWLILNYDRLPGREGAIKNLIVDNRVDMLVIDEVHYVKERQNTPTSQRRQVLTALTVEASQSNPELAVLGMSATPVVNDLHEARSLLEMIEGVKLEDLDTASTVPNAMRMHQHLVRVGSRWMPEYAAELEFTTPAIDVSHRLDDVIALGGHPVPAALDQVLLADKLDTIVAESRIGQKTLIYTQFTTGIVEPLMQALTATGLRVGLFTGDDKDGLSRFTGKWPSGEPVADQEQVDVLIGSEAISTGVDGLQHVCNTLIFATLPWTHANYQQIVGRVHRQGQQSHIVKVVVPSTFADVTNSDGDVERWSWCGQRWARVAMKESLSDCAVDGMVPRGVLVTPAEAAKSSVDWLRRLKDIGAQTITRKPIDGLLGEDVDRMSDTTRIARFGELSRMNGAWASTRSTLTHTRLAEDPTEWFRYHDLYKRARQQWSVVPAIEFAGWLNRRQRPYTVADLGCGEMLLADHLTGTHTVLPFDHVAIDDRVTACDIAALPVDDASVDVAVLSLALMGKNHTDYVREAHRILPVDGQLWLSEPTSHIGADELRLEQVFADYGFDVLSVDVREQFTFVRAIKGEQVPRQMASPIKLGT
ncbi:zinc-ribbon domain-containing protein [Rhodococcus sp. NPDC059968]|uniref:zinc-ribbon domain-containing protein n=1 Tax=Rhodococcus sp. NPDC059968 TaxID=3347017 RepID=UPI00366CF6D5